MPLLEFLDYFPDEISEFINLTMSHHHSFQANLARTGMQGEPCTSLYKAALHAALILYS